MGDPARVGGSSMSGRRNCAALKVRFFGSIRQWRTVQCAPRLSTRAPDGAETRAGGAETGCVSLGMPRLSGYRA